MGLVTLSIKAREEDEESEECDLSRTFSPRFFRVSFARDICWCEGNSGTLTFKRISRQNCVSSLSYKDREQTLGLEMRMGKRGKGERNPHYEQRFIAFFFHFRAGKIILYFFPPRPAGRRKITGLLVQFECVD